MCRRAVGAFTDFFAGIEHAANAGRRRGANPPLTPNYKYVPVAYHSRASSVIASGAPVRRPHGQRLLGKDTVPTFGPSTLLDFELELGAWIGPGNALGEPIPIAHAGGHVAGLCLLERLVGARHPALGNAAAGTVSLQEFQHHRFAVDRHR